MGSKEKSGGETGAGADRVRKVGMMDGWNQFGLEVEEGWTFIESIMVITIVLLLTSTVGVAGLKHVERARKTAAKQELAALSLALDGFRLDCGAYPSQEQGLSSLWQNPSLFGSEIGWNGPYVSKNDFTDPWGQNYDYQIPGKDGMPYTLICLGADGEKGGEGHNADFCSWDS
ncbi:MAG: type II secretion system major pseudopilin GspG [Spirochaetales bacterium]|nr:type II secretion system major pseudopilin GspG [Spirochaetales bacterium]